MVVIYTEAGWQVVTQRAHGILAAQIGLEWKKSHRPKRWLETLLAVAEHDDAEIELDGENLLTPTGGPLNYSMKSFDLEHCKKISMLTITKSRYIAFLTSMHMEFLYGHESKTNKTAKEFLSVQRRLRTRLAKELNLRKAELAQIYDYMEWCDAFSLLLCQNQIQPEKRMTEISTGPDQKPYQVYELKDGEISVDPWPFETPAFSVRFERRVLKQLTFSSSEEFRKVFLDAPVQETCWVIRKKPRGFKLPDKLHR